MDVDPPRLPVVDLAAHHRGVGVGLHLETGDAVSVNVAVLEVALKHGEESVQKPSSRPGAAAPLYHAVVEGEHAHVPAVVDVVASDDGIPVVLHPDPGQRVVADLVVFVNPLNADGTCVTLHHRSRRKAWSHLCVVRDVETHILAVTDVAVLDGRTRPLAAHTHSRSHYTHTHTHVRALRGRDQRPVPQRWKETQNGFEEFRSDATFTLRGERIDVN